MITYLPKKTVVHCGLFLQCFFGIFVLQSAMKNANVATEDNSIIAWSDKVPVVKMEDVERYKRQIISENPQIEEMLQMIPADEINRNIAEVILQQYLVDSYVDTSSVSKSPGYKEDKENAVRMAVSAVNNKYFSEEISASITLSDKELEKYYDANKARIPNVQKERGGIKTVGVSFKTEKEAQNFVKKVGSGDLSGVAIKDKLTVKDFGMISATRSMTADENVLAFALSATKFPQVKALQDVDGNWWVVQAVSKTVDAFYPFKEVKDAVAQHALEAQIAEQVTKKLTELKTQYKIRINEDFFAGEEPLEITEQEVSDMVNALEGVLGEEGMEGIEDIEGL
jgi:hypothetical protein